uniref:Uncharacterized protein n=1 Tax=Phenylobacterium glaciei TaxID=2803784 RepID=A0A974P5H0_9CAUL|nr:hypothetical protein JKL49_04975 [Phenylobacterium glaciei]
MDDGGSGLTDRQKERRTAKYTGGSMKRTGALTLDSSGYGVMRSAPMRAARSRPSSRSPPAAPPSRPASPA